MNKLTLISFYISLILLCHWHNWAMAASTAWDTIFGNETILCQHHHLQLDDSIHIYSWMVENWAYSIWISRKFQTYMNVGNPSQMCRRPTGITRRTFSVATRFTDTGKLQKCYISAESLTIFLYHNIQMTSPALISWWAEHVVQQANSSPAVCFGIFIS